MGGSNETSYFGPAINPWSKEKPLVAGGSSGGSAAAVAAKMCAAATGTDTGGSIREPSAFAALPVLNRHTDAVPATALLLLHLHLIKRGLFARTLPTVL